MELFFVSFGSRLLHESDFTVFLEEPLLWTETRVQSCRVKVHPPPHTHMHAHKQTVDTLIVPVPTPC